MSLRRAVFWVAAINLAWFSVQVTAASILGSIALLADAVDYLEDTAINLLVGLAVTWPLARRATVGRIMAGVVLVPAAYACWRAVVKFSDPEAPDAAWVALAAIGAIAINGLCAWILFRFRSGSGSLSKAAWLAARNDVIANALILLMAGITVVQGTGWPDLILGILMLLLNLGAAKEIWEAANEEELVAKAASGELE